MTDVTREDRLREMVWHEGDLEDAGPNPRIARRRAYERARSARVHARERAVQEGFDEAAQQG